MKILEINHLEDCFDGSFMKEVFFDKAVSRDFIFYLGKLGHMQYLESLPKPFYKISIEDKFILKGIENSKSARLILFRDNIENSVIFFNNSVTDYKNGN